MEQQQLNELIRLARAGNSEAISTLVKAYHSKVKATVKSLVGDSVDYRPVETHAFSNAFTHMDTLDDPADFESWLYSYVKAEADKYKKPAEAAVSDALKDLGDDNLDIPGFDNENTKQVQDTGELFSEPRQSSASDVKMPPLPDSYQQKSSSSADTDTIPAGGREISPGEFTRMFGEIPTPQSSQPKQREIHLETPDHSNDEKPVRSSRILTEPDAREAANLHRRSDDTDSQEYDDVDDSEEDYEDDDDDEERKGFPTWLLVLLIVILAIIVLGLVMYIFLPHQYNTVVEKLNEHLPLKLPVADASGSAESTPTPTAAVEAVPETTAGPDLAEATESAGPEVTAEAEATPDANATDQRSQIGTLTVNVDNLNVRDSASTSGSKVSTAASGQSYPVYDHIEAGGYTWYRIGDNQWIADNGSWVTYQGN